MIPFSKITGAIFGLATILAGADHTALVNAVGSVGTTVIIAIGALVTMFSKAVNHPADPTPTEQK